MRIVCDQHIPFFVESVHRNWPDVDVCPMNPEDINALTVRDADVLVIRTRTKVDANLLQASRVQLVCTATIGFDHIDVSYLESRGIAWVACPGCNAQAVCDYMEEVLTEYENSLTRSQTASRPIIGIVGVGHVGSRVASMAHRRGYQLLLNDPQKGYVDSLDEIARKCNVVTFHVPLDESTFHMCNADFLAKCRPDTLIINAARGGVVDERALMHCGLPYVLDTWENEPDLDADVLSNAWLASMHIAGYSLQGKVNATQMCLNAIAEHFDWPQIAAFIPDSVPQGDSEPDWLSRVTNQLKSHPSHFECLRKLYLLR